jgi:hypothetical protein
MVVAAYFHVTDCPAQANRIADRKGPTYDERDKRPTTRIFCGGNANRCRGRSQRPSRTSKRKHRREETMTRSNISRRSFIEGGVGLTVANLIPGTTPLAFAASMEERTVAAAKAAGAADVSGMI